MGREWYLSITRKLKNQNKNQESFRSFKMHFLKVNSNRQLAWLDLMNTNGLISKMIEYIDPQTVLRGVITNNYSR